MLRPVGSPHLTISYIGVNGVARRYVAIKVVRAVRKYTESARIEADILRNVNKAGPRGTSLCVQMFSSFEFAGMILGGKG
jgi:hypothetical protein